MILSLSLTCDARAWSGNVGLLQLVVAEASTLCRLPPDKRTGWVGAISIQAVIKTSVWEKNM